jgi:23S rRNA (adenine2503-C2)-methyltransferase
LPFERLEELVKSLGGAPEHARRISRALFRPASGRGGREQVPDAGSLAQRLTGVAGLPARLARELPTLATVDRPEELARQESAADPGTVKSLLGARDGATFETVLFRNRRKDGHWSLCLSTQAGCRMGCPFCATGQAGLLRNLDAAELVGQVLHGMDGLPPGERLSNLVMMGMGEPLDNLDAVLEALRVLTHPAGLGFSAQRIVLSTCGHVPGLRRLAAFPLPVGLAVSLHAATDQLRDRLVPLNRRYPLAELMETLRAHPLRTGKWICFEYVLLAGVNDGPEQVRALVPLLDGLRAIVQVIPYNRAGEDGFVSPSAEATRRFAEEVRAAGLPVAIRSSRGPDIDAACGQLRSRG